MYLVETLKLNANYATIYDTVIDGTPNANTQTSGVNFADTFHDLKMSASAIKTIKKATNVILYLSKQRHFQEYLKSKKIACTSYRRQNLTKDAVKSCYNKFCCTFVTLTLPAAQKHTDIELTKYVLHPFLSYARKYWKVRYFVWKKELQQNGNLHFHLITDRYIHHDSLRSAWNRCCNRGVVPGVDAPFDYVSRYSEKMRSMFAAGWDSEKMFKYYADSDKVQDAINEAVIAFERKNNRDITSVEYDNICYNITKEAYDKGFENYDNETKKPESERWTNPNSTDISAVKNPRQISAYVAKYIAKDIDETPEILNFQHVTQTIKDEIFDLLSNIRLKKTADEPEPTDIEEQRVQELKEELKQIRLEDCPIKGKLWFKSATLTPFLQGAKDFIYSDIDSELRRLIDYLKGKETDNKKLILYNYELDEKGNPAKCISLTLLISVFEIMHFTDKHGKKLYPHLSQMWRKFCNDCIKENEAKGLYEYESDFKEFVKL